MIEDDAEPAARADGEAMLYDYLKAQTTLCLFSLGGVAALADKLDGRGIVLVVIALCIIGIAAFCAFYACGMLVEARYSRQPLAPSFHRYRHAPPLLLSVGVGMFLYLYVKALSA